MKKYIEQCVKYAKKNLKKNEVPIAAFIIKDEKIISKAINKKNIKNNSMYHAEILAIQKAQKKQKKWNLNDCIMITTLEPCQMCNIVIREAHIKKVYYLINHLKFKKNYNKTEFLKLDCIDLEKEYKKILKSFFQKKR